MNKLASYIPVRPVVAIITGIMLVSGILVTGICATSEGEGFAIYLTRQDTPPAQMEALSHVDIAERPVITTGDIITYDAQEHELKLTASAFERISQLDVSTGGKSFIVCVDKAPIYWGAFWVGWSCTLFDGVTIWKPLSLEEPSVIRIELSEIYMGEDPRSNPVVIESLEQAGKLINDEGFAIYLTKQDIPPSQMEALSHVDLADQPIISIKDVITYDAQTHEVKLTEEAFERISQLDVSTGGKSFIVCVDKASIYWGAFWVLWSSQSFDGVTIWKPLMLEETHAIRLELGYPSSAYYMGEDPRSDPIVIESLEQAGKLINKPSITTIEELPRSFKGYELYSWKEEDQWHFTLITGTNRIKTIEEITSEGDVISETGWVKIQVVGADAIKDVLSRLPEGESVFWCDELHIGQSTETDLQLPPEEIAYAIEEYAKQCGLDFVVTVQSY
jgi:hypothetical protein